MEEKNTSIKVIVAVGVFFFTGNLAFKLATSILSDISGDEPFSICLSQFPVGTICRVIFEGNNPPLHELLLHYFTQVFGISPIAVRFLPCVFSSATACLIFLLGNKLLDFRVGIVAGLLFSFSSFNFSIAHLCRAYALTSMLGTISMLVFLLYLDTRRVKTLYLLATVNALIFYAHYFGVWIVIVQISYLFFEKRIIKEKTLSLIHLTVAWLLLILPSIYFFAKRLMVVSQYSTWIKPITSIESVYNLFWSYSNMPVVTVVCLFFSAVAVWSALSVSKTNVTLKVICLWLFLPVGLTFLISFYKGLFLDTYLSFASPAFYLLVAFGTATIADKLSSTLSFAVLAMPAAFMLFTFQMQKPGALKNEINAAVQFVEENNQKNVLTIICPNWFDKNYAYYNKKNLINDFHNFEIRGSDIYLKPQRNNLKFIGNISEVTIDTSYNQILYLDYNANFHYPNNQIENYLKTNYKTVKQIDFGSNTLKLSVYSSN